MAPSGKGKTGPENIRSTEKLITAALIFSAISQTNYSAYRANVHTDKEHSFNLRNCLLILTMI